MKKELEKAAEAGTGDNKVTLRTDLDKKQGYFFVKRAQDIVLSALVLALLSPLLLLVALLIVIDDPGAGPVFLQRRCGKNGKEFTLYKFRTMHAGAERELENLLQYNEMKGPAFKIKDDPRITKIGKILRRISIDELLQLINVLKGDMSLVGPRPPLAREVEQYTPYQYQRLSITSGLTCLWQIHPQRYQLTMDEWTALDIQYIQEQSLILDWKIMLKTISCVFHGNGQ